MSSILFDALYGTARVSGAEHAYFSILGQDMFIGMLCLKNRSNGWLKALKDGLPTGHYCKEFMPLSWQDSVSSLETALHIATINPVTIYGIDIAACQYNTVFTLGNRSVKLATRIAAQCDIHCWVADHNKKWLADIIQHGLYSGFYREEMNWSSVIELLSSSEKGDVVLSCSVGDRYHPDENALNPELELKPKNFDSYRFYYGWDVFQLIKLISHVENGGDPQKFIDEYENDPNA